MHALIFAVLICARAVDDAVRLVMHEQHVAGLSLAMSHEGRMVCLRGYGFANLGKRTAAQAGTVYRIGSLTKSFTASAVLQLARQGKLGLNDPVQSYVDVPWPQPISIEELLAQRSGVPSYTDVAVLDRYAAHGPQELIASVAATPLAFAPGSAFMYSNTNYVLLGMTVARVAGMPYGTFLQLSILTPLHLNSTRYGDSPEQARGYARDTLNLPVRATSTDYGYAAAGMTSNATDLIRWLEFVPEPYYGFFQTQFYGYGVRYARGNVDGYSAFALFDDRKRDSVVILTNADALDLAPLAMDLFATLETPKPGTRAPDKLSRAGRGVTHRNAAHGARMRRPPVQSAAR